MSMVRGLRMARIAAALVGVTAVLLPPHLIGLATGNRLRTTCPLWWHRAMLSAFGMRVQVHGMPPAPGEGTLLAANHVSWVDIMVLGSVAPLSFIAKEEVRFWPLFGQLARLQRTVFVARERRRTVKQQNADIAERLKAGDTLVLFPEGTTSDGNFIFPFKSALFAAVGIVAGEHATVRRVQPVSIAYTGWHGLPMGRFDRPLAAWPGDVTLAPHLLGILRHGVLDIVVRFGDPIDVDATTDRKALCARCEAQVRDLVSRDLRHHPAPSKRRRNALEATHDH